VRWWLRRYEGEFKNGMRHGMGLFITKKGRRYDGQWYDSLRHGKGKEVWPNGERVRDNAAPAGMFLVAVIAVAFFVVAGSVTVLLPRDDVQYEGDYVENRFHGIGVYTTRRGRYEGSFHEGVKQGGVARCLAAVHALLRRVGRSSRASRLCVCVCVCAGMGTMEWHAGGQYVGEWLAGCMHGFGKYTSFDGKLYEGQWAKQLR
jgi:hypothetical protein